MGFGCIVCDNSGALVAASNGTVLGFFTPHVVEAMGMREALSWLKQHGFSRIEIESDSLLLVSALQSSAPDSSPVGGIVLDCKNLALGFISCKFLFVFRSANQVAHHLARVACSRSWQLGGYYPGGPHRCVGF